MTPRVYLYGTLLLLVTGFFAMMHWDGKRQGLFEAEDQRLTKAAAVLQRIRHADILGVLTAKAAQRAADSAAQVAYRRAAHTHRTVGVANDSTVAIHRDSGVVLVVVPPEIVERLMADSLYIQALELKVTTRDTVMVKMDTLAHTDNALLAVKDSTLENWHHQPNDHIVLKALGIALATVLAVLTLGH